MGHIEPPSPFSGGRFNVHISPLSERNCFIGRINKPHFFVLYFVRFSGVYESFAICYVPFNCPLAIWLHAFFISIIFISNTSLKLAYSETQISENILKWLYSNWIDKMIWEIVTNIRKNFLYFDLNLVKMETWNFPKQSFALGFRSWKFDSFLLDLSWTHFGRLECPQIPQLLDGLTRLCIFHGSYIP